MKAIDLFAGAGGFTAGAEAAGVQVVWAANHNELAVETHAANHPGAKHSCQDLRQADFTSVPRHDLLLASPCCQPHSTASQPRRKSATIKHDADRSTAWAVIDAVEVNHPKAVIVENVINFRRWRLYPVWKQALEVLGYLVSEYELDAANFGTPQNRKRLFVCAFRRKRGRRQAPRLDLRPTPAVPAWTILDPSAGGWVEVAAKSENIRKRVDAGRQRLGSRFLSHYVTGHRGRSLTRPIGTITTVSHHWHLVSGSRMRPLTVRELARAQGFSDSFSLPSAMTAGTRLVGNAVPPPLAQAVVSAVAEVA